MERDVIYHHPSGIAQIARSRHRATNSGAAQDGAGRRRTAQDAASVVRRMRVPARRARGHPRRA
ncbi:hypothetical protein ACT3SZ_05435 [Corynebacterium sp. AOP40-9SA-29]|uniref:hypothetical protein n=1 Tax=Corynebacterium sp. AOP40-9SA-29 TaxID=3457677 RepID=UPI0040339A0C